MACGVRACQVALGSLHATHLTMPAVIAEATRTPGRLHGLVDHGQQFGVQGVQVDLAAEADAERLDGLGGVVPAAVEATIHDLLDAAADRPE
jgi:hypothetical protein